MHNMRIRTRLAALLLGAAALVAGQSALADPPSRVARLGYISGAVSFSPAGEDEWVRSTINRPLVAGDRLWVTPGARAELQIGLAAVRLSGSTSLALLNLDDRVTQIELTQGTLNIRVRRLPANQVFEINTPNLAFSLRRPGSYRIEVDPADDSTAILVREGAGEVYGEGAAYAVGVRQSYVYYGAGLRDYERISNPRIDEFDRWADDRDRRASRSVSLRYVSSDVIGYEDLDANGTWRTVAEYGNVWVPSRVAAGWAPYRDGHWSWVEPWGWTWIDDAPWGFAVSHYGRWANLGGTWGWVPGPARQQAVYAPALVAFVGGSNFSLSVSSGNVGGVAWFPLGPRDVYRPSYAVSREYFTRVNSSNTVINNVNITNIYNNNSTNITYVNQRVPGAVVAVPATAFVQSQPVARSAVRVNVEQIASAPVTAVAAFAPVRASLTGAAPSAGTPAMTRVERAVVARTAPPPAPVAFAARESALAATPGKPLAPAEVLRLKPGAPAVPAAPVVVVTPAKPPVPMAAAEPSKPAPEAAGRGDGRTPGQRGRQDVNAPPSDTAAKSQPAAQPAPQPGAVAPTPVPDSRVPPGQRGRVEAPGKQTPDTIPPAPVAQPAPAAPVVTPPESRTPPGQRGRTEPAPQPAAPVAKPQPVAPHPAQPASPAPVAASPVAAPADQRPFPGPRSRQEPQPQAAPQPQPQAQPTPVPQPPPVARPQPAPQPQAQPTPVPQPPPAARPQPAPQVAPPAPVAAPAAAPPEQRPAPGQRGRADAQQPAPPGARAQPAPQSPAAAPPVEQRMQPGQRGRPEPQAQPVPAPTNPNAPPPPNAQPRGPGDKPGAPQAESKRTPEQAKQDEEQRKEDEKKSRKPN